MRSDIRTWKMCISDCGFRLTGLNNDIKLLFAYSQSAWSREREFERVPTFSPPHVCEPIAYCHRKNRRTLKNCVDNKKNIFTNNRKFVVEDKIGARIISEVVAASDHYCNGLQSLGRKETETRRSVNVLNCCHKCGCTCARCWCTDIRKQRRYLHLRPIDKSTVMQMCRLDNTVMRSCIFIFHFSCKKCKKSQTSLSVR